MCVLFIFTGAKIWLLQQKLYLLSACVETENEICYGKTEKKILIIVKNIDIDIPYKRHSGSPNQIAFKNLSGLLSNATLMTSMNLYF